MTGPLIDLHHHGKAGWTWAVHHPGRVTVWRTDETGHGLQQLVADPNARPDEPGYIWVDRRPRAELVLPADRATALDRLRSSHAAPPAAQTRLGAPAARVDQPAIGVLR